MGDQFGRGDGGLLLLAAHVVDDLLLDGRDDDDGFDGVLLAEPPAAPDGLVVGLVGVREPHEGHAVGVLEVHTEPGDGRFRDEHPDLAVLERFEQLGLAFGVKGAVDVHGVRDGGGDGVGFGVEAAPDDPLVIVALDQFDGAGHPCVEGVAAHGCPAADPAEVDGEQLTVGHDLHIDDLGPNGQGREVVARVVVADVGGLAERDCPPCHPPVHGLCGVALDAPSDLVVDEEGSEHLVPGHDTEELGMVAQLGDIVGGRRGGAGEPGRDCAELLGEALPGLAVDVLQDARLVKDDGIEC